MQEHRGKSILCKSHNLVAYDICLHGNPMKDRLLCKICKQNLTKDELLESISLTDFLSGNFMTVVESLYKQATSLNENGAKKESMENQIEYFYDKIEEAVIDIIRESKQAAIRAIKDSKSSSSPSLDIDRQKSFLTNKLQRVLENWEANLYNGVLLDDLARSYADLNRDLTSHLNKNATQSQSKEAVLENFKVEGKNFINLQKNCEKFFESLVTKLKSNTPKESQNKDDKEEIELPVVVEKKVPEKEKKAPAKEKEKETAPTTKTPTQGKHQKIKKIATLISEAAEDEVTEKAVEKKVKRGEQTKNLLASSNSKEMQIEFPSDSHEKKVVNEVQKNGGEEKKLPHFIPRIKCNSFVDSKHEYVLWGALCYIEDKGHLVTGGQEGEVHVWDVDSKEMLFSKTVKCKVFKLLYIKEKRMLLVAGEVGNVNLFNVDDNYTLIKSPQVHTKQVFSAAYLSKDDLIASCGEEGNIALWSFQVDTKEFLRKRNLDTNKRQVSSLCYVQPDNVLLSGMLRGGHILVFSPDKTKSIKVVKAHDKEKSVDCLVYVPEWKQLISSGEDGCIKFWDFSNINESESLSCLKTLRRDNSYIESLAVIPEERYLFHVNLDEVFSVWDLSQDKLMENIKGHSEEQRGEAIIYLKDRKEMVTVFTEEIRFWKIEFYQR